VIIYIESFVHRLKLQSGINLMFHVGHEFLAAVVGWRTCSNVVVFIPLHILRKDPLVRPELAWENANELLFWKFTV
jgi:hypothetical protein